LPSDLRIVLKLHCNSSTLDLGQDYEENDDVAHGQTRRPEDIGAETLRRLSWRRGWASAYPNNAFNWLVSFFTLLDCLSLGHKSAPIKFTLVPPPLNRGSSNPELEVESDAYTCKVLG
jgi:hypothetical protein